jgi:hypothetical protein
MTTTSLHAPRLAKATAQRPAMAGFWQRLWAGLEAHGHRRAAAELRRLSIHHAFTDPELSKRLRAIASQSEVGH